MYINDSKSGEELDDVPSCRKRGSECTVGEKLHCMYRTELLQKYQMCSRVSLGKPKSSSTSYTLLIAAREATSLSVTPCLLANKN